jgi:lysophospholipase L1-like esterase
LWNKLQTNSTVNQSNYISTSTPYYNYDSYVYLVGRWFKRTINGVETYTTLNLGSEIRFIVNRTSTVSLKLWQMWGVSSTSQFIVCSIDGGAWQRFELSGGAFNTQMTLQIASGLTTTASHTVRVLSSGFQVTEKNWENGIALNFQGVQVDTYGYVYPWINNSKKVLFLGDSITAGIHVTDTNTSVSDMAHGELAYPTICGDFLGIQVWKQAFGFTGLSHTGDGGEPASPINIKYFMKDVPYINENPDVIVVNIGTNDRSLTTSAFQSSYDSYIAQLQTMYPNKPIFCMLPFVGAFKTEIQAVSTKYNCNFVDTTGWVTTFTDGLHPDIVGHASAGQQLSNVLQTILGSSFFN